MRLVIGKLGNVEGGSQGDKKMSADKVLQGRKKHRIARSLDWREERKGGVGWVTVVVVIFS